MTQPIYELLGTMDPGERAQQIADSLTETYPDLISRIPTRGGGSSARWRTRRSPSSGGIVGFGQRYGAIARRDHTLFVDAFRNERIADL